MTVLTVVVGLVLALFATIALLGRQKVQSSPAQVAETLERFLSGTGTDHEWDDFISIPLADPELEAISRRCGGLPEEFPPEKPGHYTSERGLEVLRGYVHQLRAEARVSQQPGPLEG